MDSPVSDENNHFHLAHKGVVFVLSGKSGKIAIAAAIFPSEKEVLHKGRREHSG